MKMERPLTFKDQIGKISEKREREIRFWSFLNSEMKKAEETNQRIETPLRETNGK